MGGPIVMELKGRESTGWSNVKDNHHVTSRQSYGGYGINVCYIKNNKRHRVHVVRSDMLMFRNFMNT